MPHRFARAVSSPRPHLCFGLLACLTLAACSNGPKDKLRGKWIGDRIENVSADDAARAMGWVKGAMWEFAGDKLTVSIPAESPRTGTFKVAKAEAEKLVLSVTRPDGQTDETVLRLSEGKTIHWDIGQNREIVLVRAE